MAHAACCDEVGEHASANLFNLFYFIFFGFSTMKIFWVSTWDGESGGDGS
jgi:hypothetical protein